MYILKSSIIHFFQLYEIMNFRGGSRGGAREPKTFFCQLAKYRQNEKKILDSPLNLAALTTAYTA